jgi:hypothetical protein
MIKVDSFAYIERVRGVEQEKRVTFSGPMGHTSST